jgi:MFS family permease
MRHANFRWYFLTYVLAMMADNIEHVISYWVMFQKFRSPALGGFAVVSHWLPFLFFSVSVGALADRIDPRRIIQAGMLLFIVVSASWGYFFATDSLRMWEAMALLVVHGCAGVLWQTSSQLLLHEVVPIADLQSGVRLNAAARYLGVLVGPAVGGAMLIGLGPAHGMILNTCYYLPLFFWLFYAPYARATLDRARQGALRGLADITNTMKTISGQSGLVIMMLLSAAASFLIGNSYQAQMPNFASDLGHANPGAAYSMLLAADAAGALSGVILLETVATLAPDPRTALLLSAGWCVTLAAFAMTRDYPFALAALFMAGLFELSYGSMVQTIVQLAAPAQIRGRVLGLFNMAAQGCRAFAGVTVGIIGALLGVHVSLGLAAVTLLIVIIALHSQIGRSIRR